MAADPQMLRTFIALPLPDAWVAALEGVIETLRGDAAGGVRWVDPSGTHLTLKFLGATKAELAPRIIAGLEREFEGAKPPVLSLSGLGAFPAGRNPRVLWAGVSGQLDLLGDWHERAERAATGLGWTRENRPFRPHLTIGRVRDRASAAQRRSINEALAATNIPGQADWQARTVQLYRSDLTPNGAIYTNLGEVRI